MYAIPRVIKRNISIPRVLFLRESEGNGPRENGPFFPSRLSIKITLYILRRRWNAGGGGRVLYLLRRCFDAQWYAVSGRGKSLYFLFDFART